MKFWREFAARHPDAANGLLLLIVLAVITPVAGHYFYWRFVAVFYIGALVGTGELVARYRDAPQSAVWTWAAALYVAINSLAGVVALYVVQIFHVAESPDALKTRITHIFLAGFGAMGFFRSSVFTVRIGEQDVAIGPVAFLQVVLRATDRAVDRVRAKARAETVTTAMTGVSFDRAHAALPAFCLALMQNVSAEEEKDIGDGVKVLQSAALDNDTKAKNLALMLLNVIGENVLVTAVARFGQTVAEDGGGSHSERHAGNRGRRHAGADIDLRGSQRRCRSRAAPRLVIGRPDHRHDHGWWQPDRDESGNDNNPRKVRRRGGYPVADRQLARNRGLTSCQAGPRPTILSLVDRSTTTALNFSRSCSTFANSNGSAAISFMRTVTGISAFAERVSMTSSASLALVWGEGPGSAERKAAGWAEDDDCESGLIVSRNVPNVFTRFMQLR